MKVFAISCYPINAYTGLMIWAARDLNHLEALIRQHYKDEDYVEENAFTSSINEMLESVQELDINTPGIVTQYIH